MAKLSPLTLSNLLRHAFMTGAGYGELERISEDHQQAWTSYEPPEPLYQRVHDVLYPQTGEAIRERSMDLTQAEVLLTDFEGESIRRHEYFSHSPPMSKYPRGDEYVAARHRILALMMGTDEKP